MSAKNIRADQLKKISILESLSLDPYPSEVNRTFEVETFNKNFENLVDSQQEIFLCGRVLSLRIQGGIIFLDISDGTEVVQVVFKKNDLNEKGFELFLAVVTFGDIIECKGKAIITKRGVKSLDLLSWKMLAKSLRQIPDSHSGLKDENEKYRKRYLDILLNPGVKDMIKQKSVFWNSFRTYMLERDFIKVETPILEVSPSGAKARQFTAHHNTLDLDVFLRISPELWHKKLIIGGLPKVFEIGRVFRNEGMSPEHAQDFTAFEFYESYTGAKQGVPMMIDMLRYVAKKTFGTLKFNVHGLSVDLGNEWEVLNFNEIIKSEYGFDPLSVDLVKIKDCLSKANLVYNDENFNVKNGIEIVWKDLQKKIGGPTIITKIPYFFVPLGKRSREDRRVMDEFKIVLGGGDVGHGFNELNDPIDQRNRFAEQQGVDVSVDDEILEDIEHVEALEYGMPPTFGMGLSERLFSFLVDKPIRDTQIFPLMKPTNKTL